jgi:hypothetical protein
VTVVKLKLAGGTVVEAVKGSRLHGMYLALGARELRADGHRKPREDDPLSVVESEAETADAGKGYLVPAAEAVAEQAPEGTVSES